MTWRKGVNLPSQPRHAGRYQHRHEKTVDDPLVQEEAERQDDDGHRPRSPSPGVVTKQATGEAGVLDCHSEVLHQEVERRLAVSRPGNETDDLVIQAAVEEDGE